MTGVCLRRAPSLTTNTLLNSLVNAWRCRLQIRTTGSHIVLVPFHDCSAHAARTRPHGASISVIVSWSTFSPQFNAELHPITWSGREGMWDAVPAFSRHFSVQGVAHPRNIERLGKRAGAAPKIPHSILNVRSGSAKPPSATLWRKPAKNIGYNKEHRVRILRSLSMKRISRATGVLCAHREIRLGSMFATIRTEKQNSLLQLTCATLHVGARRDIKLVSPVGVLRMLNVDLHRGTIA